MRGRSPFASAKIDVVFALGGDHHRAHAERPAADRDQDDRERRQDGVVDHVDDEGEVSAGTAAGGVAAVERQPSAGVNPTT